MKKLIDNIPVDKLRHIVLGLIINPIVIIFWFLVFELGFKKSLFGLLVGVVSCVLIHLRTEYWQRETKSGHFDLWDAFAGYISALIIGVLGFTFLIL